MNIIATAGIKYADIDTLACTIAYTDLLRLEGHKTEVVLPPLNQSVTLQIKTWDIDISETPNFSNFKTVMVDASDPNFFPDFVNENNLIEIYDHHFGYEEYWNKKMGTNSKIEFIGACATLILEEWVKRNKISEISKVSANLLYTAILSNTLNFKANLTTQRDIDAFNLLEKYIDLPDNWKEQYFNDQQNEILQNPIIDLKNDINVKYFENIDLEIAVSQLELWDGKEFLKNNKEEIRKLLQSYGKPWFFTLPSIKEGINYLFAETTDVKNLLEKVLNVKFEDEITTTDKLWLRKEIFKKILTVD